MAKQPQISVPELSGIAGLEWSISDQQGTELTRTTVLKGKADFGTLFNNDIMDSLPDSRIGEYGWYSGHTIRHGYGRQYDEIDLTAVELIVNYNKSGYYSEFSATARTESRPLEEKLTKIGDNDETYAVWWNHQVRALDTATALSAGQITTLKAITDLSEGTAITGYYWAKTNQAMKTGEQVFLDARFPGVQSYGVGAEQVKEVVYARKESIIKNIIGAVGFLKAPRDSANNYYDSDRSDASKWLVTAASYQKRLGWYEAQVTFAYAKGGWLAQGAVDDDTGVYPEWSA